MFATTKPCAGGEPDFVVVEPEAAPWDERFVDKHPMVPFAVLRVKQTEAFAGVQMRSLLAFGIFEWIVEHSDVWRTNSRKLDPHLVCF